MPRSSLSDYLHCREVDFCHIWHPFTQHKIWFEDDPLIVARAKGVELIDVQGNHYLDGVSSLWCNVHGHGVPEITAALHEQVDQVCHSTLLGLSHVPIIELTERLIKVIPSQLSRIFYSDSGSAAVEAAIRMSVEWWQKQKTPAAKKKTRLMSLNCGYHGDTLGSVGLGYLSEFHQHLSSLVIPSVKIDPPHAYRFYHALKPEDALEASLKQLQKALAQQADSIAAFFLEPMVQGAAGIWVQPPEFGLELERLCRKHDVLLIADEVATGFGKTGKMFALEHSPLKPDILVLGKGLSGGYAPISAAAATEKIFQGFLGDPGSLNTFFFGQTFSGNPLAASAGRASLDLFSSSGIMAKLPSRIAHFSKELAKHLAGLSHVYEVRSCGLMVGIELTKTPGSWEPYQPDERAGLRIVAEARKRGAVIRPLGNVVVLMPALAMEEKDLSRLVEITADSIKEALGE